MNYIPWYMYRAQVMKKTGKSTYLLDVDLGFHKWEKVEVILDEDWKPRDWILVSINMTKIKCFEKAKLRNYWYLYSGVSIKYEPRNSENQQPS